MIWWVQDEREKCTKVEMFANCPQPNDSQRVDQKLS